MIANDGYVWKLAGSIRSGVCLLLIDRLSNLFPGSSANLLKFHTVNISTEVYTQVLIAFSDISMSVRFMVLSNILLYHKMLRDQKIIVFSQCVIDSVCSECTECLRSFYNMRYVF